MDPPLDYLQRLEKFQSSLKFPVKIQTIQKFFKSNPDISPGNQISTKTITGVEEVNFLFLLQHLKQVYIKRTKKFLKIKEENIFNLKKIFDKDLKDQNQMIVNYFSNHDLIVCLSEKVTQFYFEQFFKVKKSTVSYFEMVIKVIKESISNSVTNESHDAVCGFLFTKEALITYVRTLFNGPSQCLENLFLKIYRKQVLEIITQKYQELTLKNTFEIIENHSNDQEIENFMETWDSLSHVQKLKYFNFIILKTSNALKKFEKNESFQLSITNNPEKEENDQFYAESRRVIINKMLIFKLFPETNDDISNIWGKNPIKLLLLLEKNILITFPASFSKKLLIKEIKIEKLEEIFKNLPNDEIEIIRYSRLLKSILRKIIERVKKYMKENWGLQISQESKKHLNSVLLSQLKPFTSELISNRLLKFLDKIITSPVLERIDVRFKDDRDVKPVISYILPTNTEISLQKLIVIPNFFDEQKFRDLLNFSKEKSHNQTFLYIWEKMQKKTIELAFSEVFSIPEALGNNLLLATKMINLCKVVTFNSQENKNIANHMKKLGKRLGKFIDIHFKNSCVSLMAFGESLEIATNCVLYLNKHKKKVIDNLIIMSRQSLEDDLSYLVSGGVFNVYFDKLSINRRGKDFFKFLTKSSGIHGKYRERMININLSEYGIEEDHLLKSLHKVMKLVNTRETL